MKDYCEVEYCDNPGFREVPVSAKKSSDQVRTLCASCEEAYSIGVQHGTFTARQAAGRRV
jgi:hypothetical protein